MTARISRAFVRCAAAAILAAAALLVASTPASAQEMVRVAAPVAVVFQIADVTQSATSGTTTLTFDSATLVAGHALRISVKADGDLTGPGGASIPASKISWTTSSVSNGIGVNGTISTSLYNEVYQSQAGATTGGLTLVWTLGGSTGAPQAGSYQTTLRWKIESIAP